jgi:hypothetical protein
MQFAGSSTEADVVARAFETAKGPGAPAAELVSPEGARSAAGAPGP